MKSLFSYAQNYIKKLNVFEFALIKFCLGSMGILLGISVPEKYKKPVAFGACIVFAMTYIKVMGRFLRGISPFKES